MNPLFAPLCIAARLRRIAFCTVLLGSVCSLSSGCQDMTGAMMEKAIDVNSEGSPKRASFAAKLRKLKEDCPMQINEYTTLEQVKMKGINRVEFRYLVSESGRDIVTMNNWFLLDPEILQRTAESPLANSVVALDLSIDHVFKDSDGKQMYSKLITKLDLKKAKRKVELAEQRKLAEQKMAELASKQPAPQQAKRKGITVTTLEQHVTTTRDTTITNPVLKTTSSTPPVETTNASNKRDEWIPEKFNGFRRDKKDTTGVQFNPYGSAPAQENPYAE